ncbi:hypothetical protein M231_00677 [Tremella mesenterica]|uniref:Uncharacterized protein n=1 Tax=Tremella mesenterica TaxID=5217 RepID=A0A4Q1BVA9_TREME|nr:hypothetical protein M231_00677 [Tremella mesenterica]
MGLRNFLAALSPTRTSFGRNERSLPSISTSGTTNNHDPSPAGPDYDSFLDLSDNAFDPFRKNSPAILRSSPSSRSSPARPTLGTALHQHSASHLSTSSFISSDTRVNRADFPESPTSGRMNPYLRRVPASSVYLSDQDAYRDNALPPFSPPFIGNHPYSADFYIGSSDNILETASNKSSSYHPRATLRPPRSSPDLRRTNATRRPLRIDTSLANGMNNASNTSSG